MTSKKKLIIKKVGFYIVLLKYITDSYNKIYKPRCISWLVQSTLELSINYLLLTIRIILF